MIRHLIILPDGTEITSGLGTANAIQSISYTNSVNKGTELTLGSVCSDMLEVKMFTPERNLSITVGTEISYNTVDDDGNRTQIGLFRLETPQRPSRHTYKFTAYDRVSWLDRDMTQWVKDLDGWPYSLLTFAQMVCDACLLNLVNTSIPNGDFPVQKFSVSKCTGREIMAWIGEICARFCRATPDGNIEFAWYDDTGIELAPTGNDFYYPGMTYDDYQVEPVEAVQVAMSDNEYGLLFPEVDNSANRYIIQGNPLISFVNEELLPYLTEIQTQIRTAIYSPCTVSIPARSDIRAGDIIRINDADGYVIQAYVMTKTQRGQKVTLQSVGSPRRDSATSLNNQDNTDLIIDAALKRLNQTAIFNKLTNNGEVEGFFLGEDGQIYINATYLSTGILQSKDDSTFFLDLDEGILKMDAAELTIGGRGLAEAALEDLSQEGIVDLLTNKGAAEGIALINGQLYINASYINSGEINADLIKAGILQSPDGETFRLDLKTGEFSMAGTGKFVSPDGKSYITIEGNSMILYSQAGESGGVAPIAQIGFQEDSEGIDYPYVMLGNIFTGSPMGLFKIFNNGIYIGNYAPFDAVGSFNGMEGAAGMFVDMEKGKALYVDGETIYDAFTAVFG